MTIRNTYAAEQWDLIYSSFSQINFTSYDFDSIKNSLIEYIKTYHSEQIDDFLLSNELMPYIHTFSYICEALAYRIDMMSHENFITTAQRKQSILKLAKVISYKMSRNTPGFGLVKIQSIKTSEEVYDSFNNNLSNKIIYWNDVNNLNWKEQFFIVMNKCLTSNVGLPSKQYQVADVILQQYTLKNNLDDFINNVFSFNASGNGESVRLEVVPCDIDENGPFEKSPDINAQFTILYGDDGKGDSSDYTGFLMFLKQGKLEKTEVTFSEEIANRRLEFNLSNINDTDVWVYKINDNGEVLEKWEEISAINEQNLFFNSDTTYRQKYEIDTLENDRIAIVFGDGNFSDIPYGKFQFWTRSSVSTEISIPKNRVVNTPMNFSYQNRTNNKEVVNLTFSLITPIQNNSSSETIEHIRQVAPSTYYSQNRMVNGQDYNTYPLKDSSILKIKTINRTFAGQPKYIEWNDSSRKYENVKMVGDDLTLSMDFNFAMKETKISSRSLIDSEIEPLLQSPGMLSLLNHAFTLQEKCDGIISYPRRYFIEDNSINKYYDINGNILNSNGSLQEKTIIQGLLDKHWYGEPIDYYNDSTNNYAIVSSESDGKIWLSNIPRKIKNGSEYVDFIAGDKGSGLQTGTNRKEVFGLKYDKLLKGLGNLTISNVSISNGLSKIKKETFTIELSSDLTTFSVISNLRGRLDDYVYTPGETSPIYSGPISFSINGLVGYQGDAFIIDVQYYSNSYHISIRTFGTNNITCVNLNGFYSVIDTLDIKKSRINNGLGLFSYSSDGPNEIISGKYSIDGPNSWVFLISRNDNSVTQEVDSWFIYNRECRLIASSNTTNFWYNTENKIIDSKTQKTVFDNIKILKSNIDSSGNVIKKSHVYDVVGDVYNNVGTIDFNKIKIIPHNSYNLSQSDGITPESLIQFEEFSKDSYNYFLIKDNNTSVEEIKEITYADIIEYSNSNDVISIKITGWNVPFIFTKNNTYSSMLNDYYLVRKLSIPSTIDFDSITKNEITGLEFLWSHFSPNVNLIDPSTSNIHDMFILTRGYYNSVLNYIKDFSTELPIAPNSLELKNNYGYLLNNKMISDTVIMHSGKIKLLFGQKADQIYRGKFKVVKSQNASFSNERIKIEIINVINKYFDIRNWDFAEKLYTSELLSLIHQKLPTQIDSVVLVPTYSSHSFGSLMTIDSGYDEILQSCATVDDIEIVEELTTSVLRQII